MCVCCAPRRYNYLLDLPLWCLTYEHVDKLTKDKEGKQRALDALLAQTPTELWLADLQAIEHCWHTDFKSECDSMVPHAVSSVVVEEPTVDSVVTPKPSGPGRKKKRNAADVAPDAVAPDASAEDKRVRVDDDDIMH